MEKNKKDILIATCVTMVVVLLIVTACSLSIPQTTGLATRPAEEMIITSVEMNGTWVRAPFPIEYTVVPGTPIHFADSSSWMNDSDGSIALVLITLRGYASAQAANKSYHGTIEHGTPLPVGDVAVGEEGSVYSIINSTLHLYGEYVTWNHSYSIVFHKMNYLVIITVAYQNGFQFSESEVFEMAENQASRIY